MMMEKKKNCEERRKLRHQEQKQKRVIFFLFCIREQIKREEGTATITAAVKNTFNTYAGALKKNL